MKQITWENKDISIGAALFPGRKKPSIFIRKGVVCVGYGFFKNEASATLFMEELGKLIGAKTEEEQGDEE